MKTLKLFIASVLLLVANAAFATDASVTSGSVGGYGGGTALLLTSGSNGAIEITKSGTTYSGTLTCFSDIQRLSQVVLVTQPSEGAMSTSQCVLVVPQGATASVSCSASLPASGGSASAQAGSIYYSASAGSQGSQSGTLLPGTYTLSAQAVAGSGQGGVLAQIILTIHY